MHMMSAQTVWETLLEGNRRYAVGRELRADISAQRRRATAAGQHPCAAVLACSDSRVPVEYLFDMGIGDLFVVRVAGNVIGMQEAASLEYAVEHMHVPLLLVLGHTGCGAVDAALSGCRVGGAIGSLMKKIAPAVDRAQSRGISGPDLLRAACVENVHQAISDLLSLSPAVRAAADSGTVTVAGALYDIETGEVTGLKT
ncbi:MAG: carbonic anhydrase [Deltaproteobacteria bacterium]|nr:carbonic anhydrase [Deltaproteobacteria bacterium]